jgi:polyhydroxyalkanoate synthase subunit PhaC
MFDQVSLKPADTPPAGSVPAQPSAFAAFVAAMNSSARAMAGRPLGGASPAAAWLAWTDWALGWAQSPGSHFAAATAAWRQIARLGVVAATGAPAAQPGKSDRRFRDPAWGQPPFLLCAQAFLLAEEWVEETVNSTPGVGGHDRALVAFLARQMLDMVSPSNAPALNPEVIAATWASGGRNFVDGFARLRHDLRFLWDRRTARAKAGFLVGRDLATTPGDVVFRNELIELIQYRPRTEQVRPEPIVITPAWIMKYYILDLSPQNSLIGYLVDQGFTVFCISWRNPDRRHADISFDAYRAHGLSAALDVALDITGAARAHLAGYCLGGTLAAITAAAMARDHDDRLQSLTMLAAQIDFSEAGELSLFIDDQQLATLDAVMQTDGVLDGAQMADAFAMLGARDLIWSKAVRAYLLGQPVETNDLMAWNADSTRMPARMHSEYLHGLFHDNAFANGRWRVDGQPIQPYDITLPVFAVGTETDHVAPWRSAFKIHRLKDAEVTFVLTNGGHNAGIVSQPGHPGRRFKIGVRPRGGPPAEPAHWLAAAEPRDGSWWPAWAAWLGRESGDLVDPPPSGADLHPILGPAPGTYVLEP